MSKATKRRCPACKKDKLIRSDQKTCGCKGNHPHTGISSSLTGNGVSDLQDTIATLRAQIQEKNSILDKYRVSRGAQIEMSRMICEAVKALEPVPHVPFVLKEQSKTEIPIVLNISDWHIGELIRPAETGGFGAFNFEIATNRAQKLVSNVLNWTAMHRLAYNIQDLHIFGIGDYVSGDIHQELVATNEFPLPGQTARAGQLIAQSVRDLAPHFRKVEFHGVGADNHGRLQKKPQAKQKSANNMSFLVHALIEAHLSDHKNVGFHFYEDMKPVVEVARHKFLITHGDTIKSTLSIPYYGMERDRAREATRRMGTDLNFDYINIGHFHVPSIVSGNMLMNGSLSGTTEFDHACGRHAAPSQISYLVHPRHGLFDFTAWKFEIEQTETDGRKIA